MSDKPLNETWKKNREALKRQLLAMFKKASFKEWLWPEIKAGVSDIVDAATIPDSSKPPAAEFRVWCIGPDETVYYAARLAAPTALSEDVKLAIIKAHDLLCAALAPAADHLAAAGKMIPADVLEGVRAAVVDELVEFFNAQSPYRGDDMQDRPLLFHRIARVFDAALAGEKRG